MQLTGQQILQIREALLNAYPTREKLAMMLRIQMDEHLEAVAGGENLRVLVFNLVSWAEQTGQMGELIQGAYNETPGNEALQQLLEWWRGLSIADATAGKRTGAIVDTLHSDPVSIDVFLSYSRKDSDAMAQVREELRAAGLFVWTDEDLEAGTPNWENAISEAIAQARAFVVLLSPDSKESVWVNNEISYAQTFDKRIFPVLIAGDSKSAVPIDLINVQWVDGRENLRNVVTVELLSSLEREIAPVPPSADTSERAISQPQGGKKSTARTSYLGCVLAAVAALLVGVLAMNLVERYLFTPHLTPMQFAQSVTREPPAIAPTQIAVPAIESATFTSVPEGGGLPLPTSTAAPQPTAISVQAATSTAINTSTPSPEATETAISPSTPVPSATSKSTALPSPTLTATPEWTSTALAAEAIARSAAATQTAAPLPTLRPTPRSTITPVRPEASTPTETATLRPEPTNTSTSTSTAEPTATSLPVVSQPTAGEVREFNGVPFIYVPAGEFKIGSDPEKDSMAYANEKPQHHLTLPGFWIMRTEVTNAQFARCVDAGVCPAPNNSRWQDSGFSEYPVTDVDWNQASAYAKWFGGRLPTEAEWEKACRGEHGQLYPWDDSAPTADLANFSFNVGDITPVGEYSPRGDSPYGLVDMAGNVWEWTSSQYKDYPYDAIDGRENPEGYASRTVRGGAWVFYDYAVRCAYRLEYQSGDRDYHLGFRLVSSGF